MSFALSQNRADSQIADLDFGALEEDVGRLQVPVNDFVLVKATKGFTDLYEDGPDGFLW